MQQFAIPERSWIILDPHKARILDIVDAVCLDMSKIKKENESLREAQIVIRAGELGLLPKPSNYSRGIWVANCPGMRNHEIELQPKKNLFRCGYCRVGGGIEQLEDFAAQTKLNFEASEQISKHPNIIEAKASGQGFVIVGAKPKP